MLQGYVEGFHRGAWYRRGGRWQWLDSGETHELENQSRNRDSMILAFKIPEAPYSYNDFKYLLKAFDVAKGVKDTLALFGAEVSTPELLAFGAAFLVKMATAESGYAQNRMDTAKKNVTMGFADGFVIGA